MSHNVDKLPKLYKLIKQYEIMENTDQSTDLFGKAYEEVLECLDKGNNDCIHDSLQIAAEKEDDKTYDDIMSLTLSTIHRINYTHNDITYCSTLFLTPYFTLTKDENSHTIHYPPIEQVEHVFQKHFQKHGLIDELSQLHIPGIKIKADDAYNYDFSDWFSVHKEALIKSNNPDIDPYYKKDISLSIPSNGELNFFPILVIYEDNGLTKEPAICLSDVTNLAFEEALNDVEDDVSVLSGTGIWTVGIPTHCGNAVDFGLEIQQDFEIDLFFKHYMQREDIDLVVFPLPEDDIALLAWNNNDLTIESVLQLSYYSMQEEDFVDDILQQISFYDMHRTYVFEESIGFFDIDNLHNFNLESLIEQHDFLLLEKNKSITPTLH